MSEPRALIADQSIVMSIVNKTVTVTVERRSESIPGVTNYYVHTDMPVLHVGDPTAFRPELIKITWKLVAGTGVDAQTIAFPAPAVIFADPTSPFLMGQTGGDTCEGFWSNMEQMNRRAFPYTIYVMVGNEMVLHDPTVENQPPF